MSFRRASIFWLARAVAVLAFSASHVVAVTVNTGDGLAVTFADTDGSIIAVAVNGTAVPLVPGAVNGLSMCVGHPITPYVLQHLDFDAGVGPVASAQNEKWDGYGSYVTWLADGGIDNSGHLLLGNGVALGVGMAMASALPATPGSRVRISWYARSASVETTHILCVRIYNAEGQDITSTSNTPTGWGYTGTSLAHGVWGFGCSQPDTWEYVERFYPVSTDATYIRVSLRHWTGGDHLLHIDDFSLDVVGGIEWSDRIPILGAISSIAGGFTQSVDVPGQDLHVDTTVTAGSGQLGVDVALQDTASPLVGRAIQLYWTVPVSAEGQQWWDDIDTARTIVPGTLYRNTFDHTLHPISLYPYSSVAGAGYGLSLSVPQDVPQAQRFEYDAAVGLSSVWEIGLSPVTAKLGLGYASMSASLVRHDPHWGFRAATQRYYELHPDYFEKRTTREGAWMWPIHPSQIANPMDFGFAFLETHPMTEAELDLCDALGIGVFYYTSPWDPWQPWGAVPEKPSYEERVAKLESWAAGENGIVTWLPDGGVGDSAHLLLGDGDVTGAGMALAEPFAVQAGQQITIGWDARVADPATLQILCVRIFNAVGEDITYASGAPAGWGWSSGSAAHFVAGIAASAPDVWEHFSYIYTLPLDAAAMRVSLRYWNSGDGQVHIDNLQIDAVSPPVTYLQMDFEVEDGTWVSAQNADWEDPGPIWYRVPRQESAQAVMNCSVLDAEGRYFIDGHSYLWNDWFSGNWSQAWPVNPDPDLPGLNTFDLFRDQWIYYGLDRNAGVYIDSVTTSSISSWENHRTDHMAFVDWPLTFSWGNGMPVQIGPQAHAEFFQAISAEVRGLGKCMMLNTFPTAMRFHAHSGDILGSEISQLVESDADSRVRRTLARHRIVSNLLQWGWSSPEYATYEQIEEFIRGQLFWGFYPAISTAGGMESGDPLNRYFSHPELYNRDRPLFVQYIPVIRQLSTAGWEPITHATAGPDVDVERFGSLSVGTMLLTVRGTDGVAADTTVTVDLTGCGLNSATFPIQAYEVLAGVSLAVQRLSNPPRAQFAVSLAAGEVGVYEFAVPSADLDDDGDVDLADFHTFAFCFNGPNRSMPTPSCVIADFDDDGDVDLSDFSVFQQCFNGPNRSPACP
ncbi:MAG: hypothetical protein JXA69_15025 [Phycisphaerae bacterium]|nr:hypothetical protein [Phycisphaerae bacterium]